MSDSLSISHLLSSNYAPSALETVTIQGIVEDLARQIHDIQPKLEQFKNVLSPLRRVPPEVIGEILWLALPEHTESQGLGEEDRAYLLGLCCISKKWREAALSTHRLWAYVDITIQHESDADYDDEYDKDGSVERILSGLNTWFGRAGKIPKTLGVYVQHDPVLDPELGETCEEYCSAAFPQLASLILQDNWRHLCLNFPSIFCFELLMDTITQHPQKAIWQSLRSLVISAVDWQLYHPTNFQPLAVLPPLTTLSLQCPDYLKAVPPEMGDISPLQLEQLISLHLEIVWDKDQVLNFLKSCQNIESCHLDFGSVTPYDWAATKFRQPRVADPQCVELAKLHTLHLSAVYPTDVLHHLTLPSLDSLTIRLDSIDFEPNYLKNAKELPLFIQRSQCQLETLHLCLSNFSDRHLLKLLSDLPSVVHLTLEKANISGLMFLRMERPEVVLPKLETIKLTKTPSSFRLADFSAFVNSRNGKNLKQASVTYCGPPSSVDSFQTCL